jgi:hypothetical protein
MNDVCVIHQAFGFPDSWLSAFQHCCLLCRLQDGSTRRFVFNLKNKEHVVLFDKVIFMSVVDIKEERENASLTRETMLPRTMDEQLLELIKSATKWTCQRWVIHP